METDPSENRARQASSPSADATALHTHATLPFPDNLPFFRYSRPDVYFVRPCFADYYDYIADVFDTSREHGVTVTGPPWVGTSVFLVYFLHRYQRQHPDYKFVLVANGMGADVGGALLWKNGVVEKQMSLSQMIREVKHDPNVIFLVDGPPDPARTFHHHYLACMSCNDKWIKKMVFVPTHCTIYVPLWDENELTAAVDALDLTDKLAPMSSVEDFPRCEDETEVEYRFRVFGGVASPCLERGMNVVDWHLATLQTVANEVDLQTGHHLAGKEGSHALFHSYPSTQRFLRGIKTASPYVTQLLSARVDAIPQVSREEFDFIATTFPAAAAIRQSILAARMLRQLQSGVQLVASSLAHPPESPAFDLKLSIQPSGSTKTLHSNCFDASDLVRGRCYVPQGNAFEAIHAVYLVDTDSDPVNKPWEGVEAVVFLAPSKFNYSVQGRRLYSLLKQLGVARDAPLRVALVFGVDEEDADAWTKSKARCTSRLVSCSRSVRAKPSCQGLPTIPC